MNKNSTDYAKLCTMSSFIAMLFLMINMNIGSDKAIILFYAIFISAVIGYFFWWMLIERVMVYTYFRSAIVGVLTVISVHILSMYFSVLSLTICYKITGGCLDSLSQPPVGLVEGVYAGLFFGVLSIIFIIGWFTIPAGVVLSILFMNRIKRHRVKDIETGAL